MDNLINAILKLSREGRRKLQVDRDRGRVILSKQAPQRSGINCWSGEWGQSRQTQFRPRFFDKLSLEQVFGNLFDNAIKYRSNSSTSPRIEVRAGLRLQEVDVMIIEVADNGRGIVELDLERIFELFRRARRSGSARRRHWLGTSTYDHPKLGRRY